MASTAFYYRSKVKLFAILMDELGLTRASRLSSNTGDMDAQLRATLDQAEREGLLTEGEVDDLLVAENIMRARRETDRQYIYAVIEVSYTINNRDIDRARDRARTLASATGEETVAAAIGGIVRPQQQQYANATGVQVAIPAIFGVEQPGEDEDND